MSVRKRRWKSPNGETKEAWVIDYRDQSGKRHQVTFALKKDAVAHHAAVAVSVRAGTHTPKSSLTVAEAGELWLKAVDAAKRERSTIDAYRIHLKLHIVPLIGNVKVAQLNAPMVAKFCDDLAEKGCSQILIRYVRRSLGAILAEAQARGLVAQNVVRSMGRRRTTERHQRSKLKVGVDIPSTSEIRALIAALSGRRRPIILTAIFTGLRISELLGLRWGDIDLTEGRLHVQQRADRYGKIGRPKSDAGDREIPLPPFLVKTLREWKLACPKGVRDLAFPNIHGGLDHQSSVIMRAFHPAQIRAGLVNASGGAKYGGLHSLRHFYASWCINRKADGGLELPLKMVQARLGHASIQMTADRYGHLFPSTDDGAELAAAERAFLI